MRLKKKMRLEKTGSMEFVVWGWDKVKEKLNDDIKAIEVLKQFVTEKLGGKLIVGECNDDEAFHVLVDGVVLHVCFVDPVEVRIFPESEIVG